MPVSLAKGEIGDGPGLRTLVPRILGAESYLLPPCSYPLGFLAHPGSLRTWVPSSGFLSDLLGLWKRPVPIYSRSLIPRAATPLRLSFRVGCSVESSGGSDNRASA